MDKKYMILDLDNCISDDGWRTRKIHWQHADPERRYYDYHLLGAFDTLRNEHLLGAAREGRLKVIILTARPVAFRAATEEWLRRKNVPFEHLLMRNNNDHRSSVQLKRIMLEWLEDLYGIPRESIAMAVDDRLDIVEMYRAEGLDAIVQSIHSNDTEKETSDAS